MVVKLETKKLINNALALATYNNKRVLVSGALENETVNAFITAEKKDYYLAKTVDVIKASPNRVKPACPYYNICGGCNLQHLSHEGQLSAKEAIVKENFQRIGKIELDEIKTIFTTNSYSYRNRVRFHINDKTKEVGFLKRESKELVPIDKCLILNERLNVLLESEKEQLIEAAFKQRKREISVIANDKEFSLDQKPIAFNIKGKGIWTNAKLFFQQNQYLLEAMVNHISSNVTKERIVELYAGVGTFSAFYEDSNRKSVAVEWNKRALEMANKNLSYTKFINQSVENWAKGVKGNSFDTMVVDPPRSGLSKEALAAILKINSETLIYTSCDSVTLSHDCSLLIKGGYNLVDIKLFDLYPQTSHIEAIAILKQ